MTRLGEVTHVREHDVYVRVPMQECYDNTGKAPIRTRWLDINEGDHVNREYRCRIVVQENKTDNRQDLFAATPPLEGKKMLISMAVTQCVGHPWEDRSKGLRLDFIDRGGAFFHADAKRKVYVKLLEEYCEEGMRGLLNSSPLRTRNAAQN